MKILTVVVIFFALFHSSNAGHILAFHFVATGSYVRIMEGVLINLAPRHKITLYSIVHDDFPHPNVTVVKVKAPPPNNFFFGGLFEVLCKYGVFNLSWQVAMSLEKDYIEGIFSDENVKSLRNSREKFDALLTFVTFSEFSYQFADVLKIPLIQISATAPFMQINDAIGNPAFLTTINSFYFTHRSDTFYKRVQLYIKHLYLHYIYNYQYIPSIEAVTTNFFPPNTLPLMQVHRNTSLLLINYNNAMGYARPNMPNVVEIGGIHCRPAKPLPSDLEEFINGSGEHGIIYFSFGSSIRSKFPDYITEAMLRVFAKIPQRVLWKWNEDISNVPDNVRVSKWYSQQDILGHNKTRLFITQSGMFSMQEAAFHGVPVLAIPIAFDQPLNAILANDLKYCEFILFCDFTEEKFYKLLIKMLNEPTYKQNVKKVSSLMRDFPLSQSQQLVWWVDYIIRHKGNPLTDNMVNKSYGLERLDVDVLLFLFTCSTLTIITTIYFVYITGSWLKHLLKKGDENKKKN